MQVILTVLRKVIVQEFYKQNTGLFMVVLLVAGGFMRNVEHIALATYALHAPFILTLYIALWLVYTVHTTRFTLQTFRRHPFLYNLRLVQLRALSLYVVQCQLLLPVIAYAGFMLWFSVQQGTLLATSLLISALLVLTIAPLYWFEQALRHPNRESFLANLGAGLRHRFTTPYWLFFIRYVLVQQPVTLVLAKVGSCLLTVGLLWIYPTDDYDTRLFLLGALVSAAIHATLIYQLYQLELTQLLLVRNLPIPLVKRLATYAFVLALLYSPEAVLMVRHIPDGVSLLTLLSVWLFGHSLFLLHYSLLLVQYRPPDRFMPLVFTIAILFFFLIMYKIPPGWLLSLNYLVATSFFLKHFYSARWSK